MFDNTNSTYKDCSIYRCRRIADLYGHRPAAVADLTVQDRNGVPHLEFSADNLRLYSIETLTNMVDWVEMGAPSEDPQEPRYFSFDDANAAAFPARYYRVLTR